MLRVLAISLLAACLLMLPAAPSQATTTYTSREGLSHNAVLALARDANGFVWIGTEHGLDRFDGRSFKRIDLDRDGQAPTAGAYVTSLHAEPDTLWIGTLNRGLLRLDLVQERVSAVELPGTDGSATVRALAARAGRLFIGTDGAGLYAIDLAAPLAGARILDVAALPSPRIWGLHAGPGGLWIGTQAGLRRLGDDGALEVHPRNCELPQCGLLNVEEISESADGTLWVGSWDHGLIRVPAEGSEVRRFDFSGLADVRVLSLLASDENESWIGTDRGLWRWSADCDCVSRSGIRPGTRDGDVGLLVTALLENGSGGVFVGTWGDGLVRAAASDLLIERRDLRALGAVSDDGTLRSLYRTRSGRLLAGFFGGGLREAGNPDAATDWRPVPGPWTGQTVGTGHVWVMGETALGDLLAGTDDGLWLGLIDSGEWRRIELPADAAAVRSLLVRRSGELWVGTSSGLARVPADGPAELVSLGDARWARQDQNVYALESADAGQLLVGTWGGVSLLDPDGQVLDALREGDDGLPGAMVWDLATGSDGRLWIAGSGGLCSTRIERARFVRPLRCASVAEGLPSPMVYGIEIETAAEGDRVWLATAFGLARFDPTTGIARRWLASDGLVDDELVVGAHLVEPSGRLVFGGRGGLVRFDPSTLGELARSEVQVRLADILQAGQALAVGERSATQLALPSGAAYLKRLPLSPGDHWIGFRLALPEAASAAPLRMRYRLDGLDPDWMLAPDPPVVSYARIPPGGYELQAQVESETGWSQARTILAIEVSPPWWESWAARLALGLIAMLAIWGAFLLRIRQLRVREAWLQAQVVDRTEALQTQTDALARTAHALADANARLVHLSSHDDLTGVANRRQILADAREMMSWAERERSPVVCALLDLDHFKHVNDAWGHAAGDSVLREFARRLRATLGPDDCVGRYGGEEFVVLLRGRNSDEALAWAETLRASLASAPFTVAEGITRAVTVSAGLSERHWASELSLEAWIATADAALYRAKAEGRNRAISSPGVI